MRIRLKGITEDTDRHGNVRVYYRTKGKPKVRLREKPGTPEFMDEYHAAVLGVPYGEPKPKRARKVLDERSFEWLCQEFYRRAEDQMTADTMSRRRAILERVCEAYPGALWADMTSKEVVEIRDEIGATNGAKNNVVKAIGALFHWASSAKITSQNPAHGITRLHSGDGFYAATVDDVRKFVKKHPHGTKAHRALTFFLFTGLRVSGVAILGRQHVSPDNRLRMLLGKTKKTSGVSINIPILPPLRAEIDATPKTQMHFITTEYGHPHSVKGLGNKMSKWCRAAGLDQASAHSFRKAGATLAAEMGATEAELMAIYGWTTLQQASLYTKTANRQRLSDSGMARFAEVMTEVLGVPLSPGVAETWDKSEEKTNEINA